MTTPEVRSHRQRRVAYRRHSGFFPLGLLDPTVMGVADSGAAWGAFLRHHLRHRGMTQQQLGDAAGINRTTISAWANGRESDNLTISSVFRIAAALGVDRATALRAAANISDDQDPEVELIRSSNRSDRDKDRMIQMWMQRREEERARRMADLEFLLGEGDPTAS